MQDHVSTLDLIEHHEFQCFSVPVYLALKSGILSTANLGCTSRQLRGKMERYGKVVVVKAAIMGEREINGKKAAIMDNANNEEWFQQKDNDGRGKKNEHERAEKKEAEDKKDEQNTKK